MRISGNVQLCVVFSQYGMKKVLQLVLFIAIAQAAGIIGAYFTADAIPTWYAGLEKPFFNPPNWVFGPVWTTLYTLMGTASYFVWRKRFSLTHAARGMQWYWIQLGLNAIWSPVFFGLKSLSLALAIILALWVAIVLTIREFWKMDWRLGVALLPYIAWVSFATLLNYSLWRLN